MSDKLTREEKFCKRRAYGNLMCYPESQPKEIALHYMKYAQAAFQLYELIKAQEECPNHPTPKVLQETIDRITRQIQSGHREDFGIELQWPEEAKWEPETDTIPVEIPKPPESKFPDHHDLCQCVSCRGRFS